MRQYSKIGQEGEMYITFSMFNCFEIYYYYYYSLQVHGYRMAILLTKVQTKRMDNMQQQSIVNNVK